MKWTERWFGTTPVEKIQMPRFDHGDMVRLVIDHARVGMIIRRRAPHFSEEWGYDIRLPDTSVIHDVREFELEPLK